VPPRRRRPRDFEAIAELEAIREERSKPGP